MIGKKFCPKCGSEEVDFAAGGLTGGWVCKNCGYSGMFPEKTLVMKDKPQLKNKKGKTK